MTSSRQTSTNIEEKKINTLLLSNAELEYIFF